MYTILKSVIDRGEYSLPDIEQKIDKLWAENKISEGQRDELVNLARGGVKPANNVDLFKTVMALEKRVKALEEGTNEPNSDTPPEWVDGMVVYCGARITFEGKIYRCIAPEGYPCSWAPYGDNGYPPYWERE
jgi:hypothetical protein